MAYVQIGVVFILVFLQARHKSVRIQKNQSGTENFHKYSLSIWIPGIFVEARNFLEPIIVNHFTSPIVFGAYAFSLTVSSLPIFVGVYYATFVPSIVKSGDTEPVKSIKKILVKSFAFSAVLAAISAFAIFALLQFLPKNYSDSVLASTFLYLIVAPLLSTNIIFLQYFLLLNRPIINLSIVTLYFLAISVSMSTVRPVSSTEIVSIIGVASLAVFVLNLLHLRNSDRFARI
jgi:O-antigen/teichoic acid export membrane protein